MRWLALMLLLGCKGDPEKCEKAARNYAQLVYWDKADKEIAAAPADQREALRKQKLAEFTASMEKGIQTVVSQCTSANNKDQINCMIDAKTADQARKCVND